MNVAGFTDDKGDWPDYEHLTRPSSQENFLKDYGGFSEDIKTLLRHTNPKLDIVRFVIASTEPLITS